MYFFHSSSLVVFNFSLLKNTHGTTHIAQILFFLAGILADVPAAAGAVFQRAGGAQHYRVVVWLAGLRARWHHGMITLYCVAVACVVSTLSPRHIVIIHCAYALCLRACTYLCRWFLCGMRVLLASSRRHMARCSLEPWYGLIINPSMFLYM